MTIKQNGAVSSIDFSPVEPYNYLVCSSTKAHIKHLYCILLKTFSFMNQLSFGTFFYLYRFQQFLIYQVQVFSPLNVTQLIKSYHRFKDVVHSASYRADAQLFVVACEDKHIRVVHKKHFEQVFNGHTGFVNITLISSGQHFCHFGT